MTDDLKYKITDILRICRNFSNGVTNRLGDDYLVPLIQELRLLLKGLETTIDSIQPNTIGNESAAIAFQNMLEARENLKSGLITIFKSAKSLKFEPIDDSALVSEGLTEGMIIVVNNCRALVTASGICMAAVGAPGASNNTENHTVESIDPTSLELQQILNGPSNEPTPKPNDPSTYLPVVSPSPLPTRDEGILPQPPIQTMALQNATEEEIIRNNDTSTSAIVIANTPPATNPISPANLDTHPTPNIDTIDDEGNDSNDEDTIASAPSFVDPALSISEQLDTSSESTDQSALKSATVKHPPPVPKRPKGKKGEKGEKKKPSEKRKQLQNSTGPKKSVPRIPSRKKVNLVPPNKNPFNSAKKAQAGTVKRPKRTAAPQIKGNDVEKKTQSNYSGVKKKNPKPFNSPQPKKKKLQSPKLVPAESVTNCKLCLKQLTKPKDKSNCRACGNVFCSSCTKSTTLPLFGITEEVCVCNPCCTKEQQRKEKDKKNLDRLQKIEQEEQRLRELFELLARAYENNDIDMQIKLKEEIDLLKISKIKREQQEQLKILKKEQAAKKALESKKKKPKGTSSDAVPHKPKKKKERTCSY